MKLDKEHLIEACKRKDQRACKQLYDTYAPMMLGLCQRLMNSYPAAQDVLHDGFIKVFEKIHTLNDPNAIRPWIRKIMFYTAINALRSEHPTADFDDNDPIFEGNNFPADDIYSSLDIPVILSAVQQLPYKYRLAFNLCVIEELSFTEAAEYLGVEESTVRSNLYRARAILAKKLLPLIE